MHKHIKKLLKDKKVKTAIALLITVSIAVLCLIKIGNNPLPIKNYDKLGHLIVYLFLTLSWLFVLNKNTKQIKIVIISCVVYGIIIEVLQFKLTTYRTASYLDTIANTIGVLLALSIFLILKKHIN
ncbi:MAG: VanZ family protein [Tenacibaculum sp.]